MNDVQKLLKQCKQLGAELIPTEHGTIKIRSPQPLPEALREALKRHKPAVLRLLTTAAPAWPCPRCGGHVRLESPDQSLLPTRLWTCPSCRTWGATREGAPYPAVWVSSGTVQ